jgi:vacuolar-type H+-ATPase subunit H
MDEIINNIMNIDKETVKIKLKTEELIENKEKELREALQKLEKDYMEEGRLEGERIYNEVIKNGELETKQMKSEDMKTLNSIDDVYKKNKDQLVDGLWNSLFKGKE